MINIVLDSNQVKSGLASFIEQFGSDNFDGFIDDPAFVYSDFVWSCRTNPEVLKVYQQLYNFQSTTYLVMILMRLPLIVCTSTRFTRRSTIRHHSPSRKNPQGR